MKSIKDFPNYKIDEDGNVYNAETEKKLKPRKNTCGYYQVGLYNNSVRKFKLVHVLVAETFIREKAVDEEVDHINHDLRDNALSNLRIIKKDLNRTLKQNRCAVVEKINEEVCSGYLSLCSVKTISHGTLAKAFKRGCEVCVKGRTFIIEKSACSN